MLTLEGFTILERIRQTSKSNSLFVTQIIKNCGRFASKSIASIETKLASGSFTSSAAVQEISAVKAEAQPQAEPTFGEEIPLPEDAPPMDGVPDVPPMPAEAAEPSPVKQEAASDPDQVEMIAFGELLDAVKAQNMIIYSMLSDSYADICKNNILKIYVNPMGYLMLSDDAEKTETIANAASKILGMPVKVVYVKTDVLNKDRKTSLEDF